MEIYNDIVMIKEIISQRVQRDFGKPFSSKTSVKWQENNFFLGIVKALLIRTLLIERLSKNYKQLNLFF